MCVQHNKGGREEPIPDYLTSSNTRWSVIWWSKKGKRFIEKKFGNDLPSAMKLHAQVVQLGAPMATLRSCNVGFAPPDHLRPHTKTMYRKVKRGRKIKRVPVEVSITPMREYNLKGAWWCPYCIKLRKFEQQDGAMFYDGHGEQYVPGPGMYCPVCQISHTDHHVRKWNPQAQTIAFRTPTRRSRGTKRNTRGKRARSR